MKDNVNNSGSSGFCICLICGEKVPHKANKSCKQTFCLTCNMKMIRVSAEHQELLKKLMYQTHFNNKELQ